MREKERKTRHDHRCTHLFTRSLTIWTSMRAREKKHDMVIDILTYTHTHSRYGHREGTHDLVIDTRTHPHTHSHTLHTHTHTRTHTHTHAHPHTPTPTLTYTLARTHTLTPALSVDMDIDERTRDNTTWSSILTRPRTHPLILIRYGHR